ncbi:hypothetical protein GPECTOR_1g511 [Gonium pectorale]|uniref:Uncharacterized protein n=1 Tax=Gonium pectorale TaxID=33097 RepID=A0A150H4P7_GONPE|nr:hypothetical protein GPECTOR_1g511 [Gonium pectorale]|eukprot:KXZ56570.1 hypothetical protein GPECTOR_1g511 [Gonium pectorale]
MWKLLLAAVNTSGAPAKSSAIDFPAPTGRSRRYGDASTARPAKAYVEVDPSPYVAEEDGLMDDLQFNVDDVHDSASGVNATRAFSRAVYVPFSSEADAALSPRSALESKVEQLVGDFGPLAPGAAGLEALAAHLRSQSFLAEVLAPPRPSARAPLSTRSINAPFLVVTRPQPQPQPQGVARPDTATVIVDPSAREYLALAPSSPAYEAALEAAFPGSIFVGSRGRLARLVAGLGPAIAAAFAAAGMEVPPWRRTSALQHRWSGVEELRALMQLRWEEEQQVQVAAEAAAAAAAAADKGATPLVPPRFARYSAPGEYPERDEEGDVSPAVVLRSLSAANLFVPSPAPVVSVVGFEVGSVAVGREPWRGAEPGAFSAVAVAGAGGLFSRASQAESDDGTASAVSDEAILGLSPVSVFRDAPPHVPAALKASALKASALTLATVA